MKKLFMMLFDKSGEIAGCSQIVKYDTAREWEFKDGRLTCEGVDRTLTKSDLSAELPYEPAGRVRLASLPAGGRLEIVACV